VPLAVPLKGMRVSVSAMVTNLSPGCRDLIEHQRGVLARWQVADNELDRSCVDNLLRSGRWQRLYLGMYAAFTGVPSRESLMWAALLRCGLNAALSYFTAAELDDITGRRTESIHVTIPSELRVRISAGEITAGLPAIVVHRSARLDMARHPARTPPRTRVEETVLDLIELAPDFESAFTWLSATCGGRHVMPDQIRAAMTQRRKMRWRADVLEALADVANGVHSNLERRYYRDVERAHGLPKAKRQVRITQGGRSAYLDNLYVDFGVASELDGRAWHPDGERWRDIHRDNFAARSGIVTLRYNWADVTVRPCQVATEVASVLRQHGWTGTLRACGPTCQAIQS
jgi:very-short-patch-repair endonuclease